MSGNPFVRLSISLYIGFVIPCATCLNICLRTQQAKILSRSNDVETRIGLGPSVETRIGLGEEFRGLGSKNY